MLCLLPLLQFGVYGPAGLKLRNIQVPAFDYTVFLSRVYPVHILYTLYKLLALSCLLDNMMTQGKSRLAPAVSSVPGIRPQKRAAKSAKGAPKPKRAKSASPTAASRVESNTNPNHLRLPIASEGATQATATLQDIAAIVSGAAVEGLMVAGSLSEVPAGKKKEDSNPAASVQGSVAAVIQDFTGEKHPPLLDKSNSRSYSSPLVTQPLAEADDRPEIIHHQIAVPLAFRVSDKIQSKIWANEYIDLGILLHRTSPTDSKYNFVVQTTHSADRPVISLEPAQKTKRITTNDQWITAFHTFAAIYTVRFPNDAPALMKYSDTVRDLAAKNVYWCYYDENFRFLRQKHFSPGTKSIANCGCLRTTCKNRLLLFRRSHTTRI